MSNTRTQLIDAEIIARYTAPGDEYKEDGHPIENIVLYSKKDDTGTTLYATVLYDLYGNETSAAGWFPERQVAFDTLRAQLALGGQVLARANMILDGIEEVEDKEDFDNLIDILRFYSNSKNYKPLKDSNLPTAIEQDKGKKARYILKIMKLQGITE